MRVGYQMVDGNEVRSAKLAIIISHPTTACGIIVLLKTPTKYREFSRLYFLKQSPFSLFLILRRRVQLPYLESMV